MYLDARCAQHKQYYGESSSSFFRRRHVLFVTDVEAAGGLADVRLVAFGAIIFVDALFVEGIRFGFVS